MTYRRSATNCLQLDQSETSLQAEFLIERFDGIEIGSFVQFLLTINPAVRIVIKNLAVTQDSRVTLGGQFVLHLHPKLLLDFSMGRRVGQVIHAADIAPHVVQFFGWTFAKAKLKEAILWIALGQRSRNLRDRHG